MAFFSYSGWTADTLGNVVGATQVEVVLAGTSTPATLYSDGAGTGKANPFNSDAGGRFEFYAAGDDYDVKIGTGPSQTITRVNLVGDAAFLTAQTGFEDATANRALKVGAFGLGTGTIADDDADKTSRYTGFSRFLPTNGPDGVHHWYGLTISRVQDDRIGQLAIQAGNYGLDPSVAAVRYKHTSGWAPWSILYGTQNLLGTVSQSGGVPTGEVIERGSNANGEYVRFADGTQICISTRPAVSCETAQGALFMNTSLQSWTFPSAFVVGSQPAVVGGAGTTLRFVGLSAPSTTTVSYRVLAALTDATTYAPTLIAVGRWF